MFRSPVVQTHPVHYLFLGVHLADILRRCEDVQKAHGNIVTMTLTAMGCPLASTIEMDVKRALSTVQEI